MDRGFGIIQNENPGCFFNTVQPGKLQMSYGLGCKSQIDIVVIRCDSYIYLALC